MHPTYRSMAFLLSMGTLPLGCPGNDNETTAGTTNPAPGTDSGSDTSATAPTDPTTPTTGGTDGTGTGDATTTTTTGSPTTIDPPTTGDPTRATGDTSDLPPATDPDCIAYGNLLGECFGRYGDYAELYASYCQYTKDLALRIDGPACRDAVDAVYVCLSTLECADFEGEEMFCTEELAAAETACPMLFKGDDDGDGDSGAEGP